MSEIIQNPFKDEWENFDKEEFRDKIMELIDDMLDCSSYEELYNIINELDQRLSYYMILFKFRDADKLEVVPADELPEYLLKYFADLDPDKSSVIPVDIIRELEKEIGSSRIKENDNKKNNWLL